MPERNLFVGGEFLIRNIRKEDVFTPEAMTKEHKMIYSTTIDFVKKEVHPLVDQIEEKSEAMTRSLLKQAGRIGLNGTDIPEEFGGEGMDKINTCLVTDALGGSASFAVSHSAHTGIGSLPIVYFGTDDQKEKYLPKLVSAEWVAAYCLTESGAGSDALNAQTTAKLSDDGRYYVLNGEKVFITNGAWADLFIVYAKVDGKKFTGFIVERRFPGISNGVEERKMGINGTSTTSVIFKDCQVPVENVLFEVGKGHKIAFNILNIGRFKLGVGVTGGCKHIIAEASRYANSREQFGEKISSFGMIKNKLADMSIRTYMAESISYRLAAMMEDNMRQLSPEEKKIGAKNAEAIEEYAAECSIAKVYCSECLDFCVDELVQIFGGYGYIAAYPAERMYRDARINRIFDGTNEINRLLIPGTILKRAMQGKLALFDMLKAVEKEVETHSSNSIYNGADNLYLQEHLIEASKKILLLSIGGTLGKFSDTLADEQEILALLADMIIEVFAMESGLLRAKQFLAKEGPKKARYQLAAVKVYFNDVMPKIVHWAKQLLAAAEGDEMTVRLAAVNQLASCQPQDTIPLRRLIAKKVIKNGKYPF